MGMFDGIVSAGIGAVGSLLGGINANNQSWDIAQATNQANAQEAQKNRDFQEQQRQTQYQTAVSDLQKAGLNPMLAYTQGGAGTTGGAQATMQQAQYHDAISPAVNTALNARMNASDVALKAEQADASNAQAEQTRALAIKTVADTAKSNQDTATSASAQKVNEANLQSIAADIALKNQQKITSSATAANIAAENKLKAQQAVINAPEEAKSKTWWGRNVSPYIHDFTKGVNSATNAASMLAK